ncbi:unnamed protein product [Tetraodon nigroviridis]|uniref:(spotted green pufferfish) hypothetical protein n=1 Tax=Tetraodon nigroviridis TaxID=99883 RepID=Q4ST58_TETNG|nr:unnamed protein product [Tetraodon nigroviridis]
MDPHRRGLGLCVSLWTDSVLSCDGRHGADHLGFGGMFHQCGEPVIVGYIHSAACNHSLTNLTGGKFFFKLLFKLKKSPGSSPVWRTRHCGLQRRKKSVVRSKATHAPLPSDDVFKSRKSVRGRVPPIHSAACNHSLTNLTGDPHQCGGPVIVGYIHSAACNHSLTNLTGGKVALCLLLPATALVKRTR